MPRVDVVLYLEDDGDIPFLDWLFELRRDQKKAILKCFVFLEQLRDHGRGLGRPTAAYLRDGIYELRPTYRHVCYRVLYFYAGNTAAVVSHGIAKEDLVPDKEIELAVRRKKSYEKNPAAHTAEVSLENLSERFGVP